MIYYPKSHITPNLLSNGTLAYKASQTPYNGYYFAAVDGKNFTGRFPGDGDNLELIPTLQPKYKSVEYLEGHTPEDARFYPANLTYSTSNNVEYGVGITTPPIPFYPIPTEADYKLEEFTRYFTKKFNNEIYYETSGLYKNPLYISLSVTWTIKGDKTKVYNLNKNLVKLKEQQLSISGLGAFINFNYLKFYQDKVNQLNDFHIMPDGSIMEGKTHEEYLKTITPVINTQTSASTSSPVSNNINRGGY